MQPATVLLAAFDLGGYVSIFKLIPIVLILLAWSRIATWIDKDAEAAHLPRELLNTVVIAGGLLSFALFLILPNFWLALGALIVVQGVAIGSYLGLRQKNVGLGDLKTEFSGFAKGIVKREKKVKVVAGQVVLASGKGAMLAAPEDDSDPDALGYQTVQTLLTEPLTKGAERIEVRPSNGAAAVQFVVDGVAYTSPTLDAAAGGAAITYIKKGAGLDVEEQRKPQTGKMRATLNGKRHDLEVATAGTTAGESLRITIDPKKRYELRLDGLGLQEDQMATLQRVISENPGITLFATPRGQGLTSMLYSVLHAHDAYVSHIQTVEHDPQEDLEGITQNSLSANASATDEFKQVEWVCSQQPDVLMVDEISNPASAREIVRFASEGRRAYIGIRAGSTFDALTIWRRLVGDDNEAASQLRLVMAGRVMRRLCMACKVPYAPDADTLRKLNMDPAKVTKLFQARTQPLRDNRGNEIPCEFCNELHYKGRFGVYELFVIDDEVRQVIATGGSSNQLKTVFRKQHARYLQEVALMQVEAGETSVQEVLRVMRSADQPTHDHQHAGGAGRAVPRPQVAPRPNRGSAPNPPAPRG